MAGEVSFGTFSSKHLDLQLRLNRSLQISNPRCDKSCKLKPLSVWAAQSPNVVFAAETATEANLRQYPATLKLHIELPALRDLGNIPCSFSFPFKQC